MPIPLPNLDDHRWSDLVEEGKALIPRNSPLWTDHNVHDPGITLIELFAWLTETNIFRINQISDRQYLKFLSLLGFYPHDSQPAQALLVLTTDDYSYVPFGSVFETDDDNKVTVPYQAKESLYVVNNSLDAIQVDTGDGPHTPKCFIFNGYQSDKTFAPFGLNAQRGATLYLGFQHKFPLEKSISLGFAVSGKGAGFFERNRIIEEARFQHKAYRYPTITARCDMESELIDEPSLAESLHHHSVHLEWEYFANSGVGQWHKLDEKEGQVFDNTRSFTLDGTIRLRIPKEMEPLIIGDVDKPLFYVRVKLASGSYDAVPWIMSILPNVVFAEQAIPVWQSWEIAKNAVVKGTPPKLGKSTHLRFHTDKDWVISELEFNSKEKERLNTHILSFIPPTTSTSGKITLELAGLGTGSGTPNQAMELHNRPGKVVSSSMNIYSLEDPKNPNQYLKWDLRNDLDSSNSRSYHYVLDPTENMVTFGDGNQGVMPSVESVILGAYRITLAENGNLPAGTKLKVSRTPLNNDLSSSIGKLHGKLFTQSSGGTPAETIKQALARAVQELWSHEWLQTVCAQASCQTLDQLSNSTIQSILPPKRAINTLDIERLAFNVPGTVVHRARAWVNKHPDYPCYKVANTVTLVIVPELPIPQPSPTKGLLKTVFCYLNCRRIVTTKIEVVGPSYRVVGVRARIKKDFGVSQDHLHMEIIKSLDRFLDPLNGGPESNGLPFGRDVYLSEVYQIIENIPGVVCVEHLELLDEKGEHINGNYCVDITSLVTPGNHEIKVV